jgi:hypothetical protein
MKWYVDKSQFMDNNNISNFFNNNKLKNMCGTCGCEVKRMASPFRTR